MLNLSGVRAIHALPGSRAVKTDGHSGTMIARISKKIDKQIDLLFALGYTENYTSKKIMWIGGYSSSTSRGYINELHAAGLLVITRARVSGQFNTYKRAKRVSNCSQEARNHFWQHKLALKESDVNLAKEHLKKYISTINNFDNRSV